MNRQIHKILAAISLFTLLVVPVLNAQSNMLVADIPFNFNVGKAALPAGKYEVKPLNPSALLIQGKDRRNSAIALTIASDSTESQQMGKLVFNKYEHEYFLSKVLHPGHSTGHELVKSRAESELARYWPNPDTTFLIAKTK